MSKIIDFSNNDVEIVAKALGQYLEAEVQYHKGDVTELLNDVYPIYDLWKKFQAELTRIKTDEVEAADGPAEAL